MEKNYSLNTTKNENLQITTFSSDNSNFDRAVIFVHGFKGFKDWGFYPFVGKYFSQKGFFAITLNFSHNGIGENPTEFTKMEKFQKNTFSLEVEELNEIIDAIRNNFFENLIKDCKVFICGHSRGGAISILTASKRNDITALAVWASISKLDRYSKRQKEEWRKKGYFEVMNMRTKQIMRIGLELLDDIEKNSSDKLNIEKAVKNLKIPLLIAHGEEDLAVPIKEAEQLYQWADKSNTKFIKISATGHTFDITHPFTNSNSKFDYLIDQTYRFFLNNLEVSKWN